MAGLKPDTLIYQFTPESKLLDIKSIDSSIIILTAQEIIKNVRGTTCEFPWTLN